MSLRNRILNNNSIWAVAFLFFKSIANFWLTPYYIGNVGIEQYGYISLAYSLVLYIDLISVAINYFSGRNITIAYHKSEYEKAKSYYSSIIYANLILCIALGFPSLLFIRFCDKAINISDSYLTDVKILFFLILCKYFIMLFSSVFDVGAFIKNSLDRSSKNRILSFAIYILLSFSLFELFPPKIWYVGVAVVVEASIYCFLQFYSKQFFAPQLKANLSMFSFSDVRYFLKNGIWIALNNFGNILNDGLDLLITNIYISEEMVGILAIAKMVGNFCYSIITAICNSLRPKQIEDYSKDNIKGLIIKLKHAMRITSAIYCLFLGSFIGCGRSVLRLWIKGQDIENLYLLTILAILGYLIPAVVSPLYYVYVLAQKVKLASYITIAMGIVNVVSMFVLLNYTNLGPYAVLLTTAVVNLVHLVDTPLYSTHCLGVKWNVFYTSIISHLIIVGISITSGLAYAAIIPGARTWFELIFELLGVFIANLVCIVFFWIVYKFLSSLAGNKRKCWQKNG